MFNVSFITMYFFITALTNVAAKTACTNIIALSGTLQKALHSLSGHNCVPCAEPREEARSANYLLSAVNIVQPQEYQAITGISTD